MHCRKRSVDNVRAEPAPSYPDALGSPGGNETDGRFRVRHKSCRPVPISFRGLAGQRPIPRASRRTAALSLTPERQGAKRQAGVPSTRGSSAASRSRRSALRGKTMPTFRAVAAFCGVLAQDRHFVTPNHEPRRDLFGTDLGVGRTCLKRNRPSASPSASSGNRSAPNVYSPWRCSPTANAWSAAVGSGQIWPLGIRQENRQPARLAEAPELLPQDCRHLGELRHWLDVDAPGGLL